MLSVFTLNYDDLVERCEPLDPQWWYDGFTVPEDNPAHYLFNRREFVHSVNSNEKELLCHMHGSIRYGYTMSGTTMDLVKFETAEQAAPSLDYGKNANLAKGESFTKAPIITGFSKAAKLTYTAVPYGHYFKAFSDSLMRHHKMVVIGYGGYDDHVNAWFDEFTAVHQDARRVIYITPRTGKDPGNNSKLVTVMHGLSQPDSPRDFYYDAVYNPVEFHPINRLGLCAAGFPLVDFNGTMSEILKFLKS